MIEIKNVSKSFGPNHVMKNVSVSFYEGDVVAIQGANGSGKTTLLRLLLGYYRPSSGQVLIDDVDPNKSRVPVVENVSFVPQMAPFIKLSVKELLDFICESSDVDRKLIEKYANLMDLDLEGNYRKPYYRLSGGMKQKFLISVAMAENKKVMIFDEPTASLDINSRRKFYNILKSIDFSNKIILVIAHNSEFDDFINRTIKLDLGELVSDIKKSDEDIKQAS